MLTLGAGKAIFRREQIGQGVSNPSLAALAKVLLRDRGQ